MDTEHRAVVTKSLKLIELTQREVSQLREELQSARDTIERSQELLSRPRRKEPG